MKLKYLFLDRDGVINTRWPGRYVLTPDQFEFIPGVLDAIKTCTTFFDRIFVVTNQQGIGKQLMTEKDLDAVHKFMLNEVEKHGGKIDAVYYAPGLAIDQPTDRKPKSGMGNKAKEMFPEVEFNQSIMVGDMPTDMEFGKNLGMTTVRLTDKIPHRIADFENADYMYSSLPKWVDDFLLGGE